MQYKTGTASVTNGSATVTGTNTLWASNVTVGDSFTIASTGVMYDVASVDSDTQVTLSVNYAGSTASGVVYAIGTGFTVPDSFPEMSQGDIETATIFTRAMRKIQGKISALVSDISGKAAIAGQIFTGEIVYRGAGGVSTNTSYGDTSLSSNTSGSDNSTNGSGSGQFITTGSSNTAFGRLSLPSVTTGSLNTAIGSNSGVGLETGSGNSIIGANVGGLASGLTNNLILASGGVIRIQHNGTSLAINGPVNFTAMPQVGGDPIVESGSNADGEWAKWSDGTMTQFGTRTNSIDFTNAQGDFFRNFGSAMIITLPLTFFGTVADYSSSVQIGGADFQTDAVELIGSQQAAHITTSEIRAIFISQVSATETLTYAFQAIGRWK